MHVVQPYSFSVSWVSMHSQAPVVAAKGPGKGPAKGPPKGKGKSPAAEQAEPVSLLVCFLHLLREMMKSTASTVACLTMSIIAVLSCSVHDLVISLCIAFLFGTLRPVWVVFLVVVPVMMY